MTDLVRYRNPVLPVPATRNRPSNLRRIETGLEQRLARQRAVELLARDRVQVLAGVAAAAMAAQTDVSSREVRLVELEGHAVHGVSHISARLTLALGQVIDDTAQELRS